MPPVDRLVQELRDIEAMRGSLDQRLGSERDTLTQTHKTVSQMGHEHRELGARITVMKRLVGDLKNIREAIEGEKRKANQVANTADETRVKLLGQVGKRLDQDRRRRVEQAIANVDKDIEDRKEGVQKLERQANQAATALAEAQARASALDASGRESMTELRQLPQQIQASRAQVLRLEAATQAALANGRDGEAFYLCGELQRAVVILRTLAESPRGTELSDLVAERWLQAGTPKSKGADAAAGLEKLRRELTLAGNELRRSVQQRDRTIRAALPVKQSDESVTVSKSSSARRTSRGRPSGARA
jgi:hypothetical protein